MTLRTQGVLDLVNDALSVIPSPYGADIILDVCNVIQANPSLMARYNTLVGQLKKTVVNNWIGNHTRTVTGMKTIREVDVPSGHTSLVRSYSRLTY